MLARVLPRFLDKAYRIGCAVLTQNRLRSFLTAIVGVIRDLLRLGRESPMQLMRISSSQARLVKEMIGIKGLLSTQSMVDLKVSCWVQEQIRFWSSPM